MSRSDALRELLRVPAPDWAQAAAAKLGVTAAAPPTPVPEPAPQRAKAFRELPCNGYELPESTPAGEVVFDDVGPPWELQLLEECRRWHHGR